MSSFEDIRLRQEPRVLVPVLVFLCMVTSVVSSLGAPLIPTIAAADHVSLASAQWSLTIALLVGALATPTMGRLGDGPRRRPVILGALVAATVGGVLAALPLSFGWLLLGRALMGTGLGLTPLAMATARDALAGERSRSAIALLSITTVIGVGLGYPITGLITTVFGFRSAFWFGAAVTGIALVAAWRALPDSSGPGNRLDVVGGLLLGGGLAALVLGLSEEVSWGWTSPKLLAAGLVALVLLAGWVIQELRTEHPLIDLSLLRNRTVLTADVTGLLGGVGMYLLISVVIRFVQTPPSAGYGFGASVVVAGLVLLPFSVASITASRVAPLIARRTSPDLVLPVGCAIFVVATLTFALARGQLWELFVVMGVAGLGVGCTFAALPGLIVRSVPPEETGSAMSFNQVLRYVGYAIGSALSATILAAHTPHGRALPLDSGYGSVALLGCVVLTITAVVSFLLPRAGVVFDRVLVEETIADAVPYDQPPRQRAVR
jgi:predicted MFS family arabinose efflux permease